MGDALIAGLSPRARAAAETLRAKHPEVVFTSGRRGVADQARAMAANLVANRKWIVQTYMDTAEARALQAWVDRNPNARARDQLAAGLAGIMTSWSDLQRAHVSKHFSGDAFDVQPIDGAAGEAIKASIRALPGLVKFLDHEGGLIRWHAQFA